MIRSRSIQVAARVPVGWLFLAPAVIIVAYVVIYPVLSSIYLSFFDATLINPDDQEFVGLSHFSHFFNDPDIRTAAVNTVVFTVATVATSFALGLMFALLIDGLPSKLSFARGLLLAPWVVPAIVVGFLFLYLFDQEVGALNIALAAIHAVPGHFAWLSDERAAMLAVIIANVWSQTPLYLLMFTAALTAIPADLQEAMRVDGVGAWGEFRYLTLPYLRNVMVVATLLMLIRNLNNFPVIWTMTQGGPVDSTTTLAIFIYRLAFQQFNFGYSSAVGVVWLVVIAAFALLYIRLLRREPLG
jgi:multiple sugar transport system permease protein